MRHHHPFVMPLLMAGIVLATADALAQGPPDRGGHPALRPAASTLWIAAVDPRPPGPAIVPDAAGGVNGTVVGLLVGAGLGFVAGWAFYDAICEAVDNRCSDSRAPHLVIGTAVGAGLGALVGSVID